MMKTHLLIMVFRMLGNRFRLSIGNLIRTNFLRKCTNLPNSINSSESLDFRDEFLLPPSFDFRVWFPMHMSVQLQKMEGKLRTVDLIIEVHDARIPISGRNPKFYEQLYAIRPHILVMNKMDLIDMRRYRLPVDDYYRERGIQRIIWTDCKRRLSSALSDLRSEMLHVLTNEPRYNRAVKTEYQVMVVGIPNVGKSSLINSLRSNNLGIKRSAVTEGARPGVTVRVQNRVRVLDRPPVYVLDTPGVLPPHQRGGEEAMKLSLCDLVLESRTQPKYVADYLLYWMNRTGDYSYVDILEIAGGPCDDIDKVLLRFCKSKNIRTNVLVGNSGYSDRWDFDKACKMFINIFRNSQLKDHCLDKELLLRYM